MRNSYDTTALSQLLQTVIDIKEQLGKQVKAAVAAYGILLLESSPDHFIQEEQLQAMLHCGRTTVKEIFAIYRVYLDRVQNSEQCLSDHSISLDQHRDRQTDLPCSVSRTLAAIVEQYFRNDPDILAAATSFLLRINQPECPIAPDIITRAAEITAQDCNDASRTEPIQYPYKWWLAIIRNLYQDQLRLVTQAPVSVYAPGDEVIQESQEFAQAILDSAVSQLEKAEGRGDISIWFSKIKAVAYKARAIYLSAEDEISRDWIQSRWLKLLSRHLSGFKLVWC